MFSKRSGELRVVPFNEDILAIRFRGGLAVVEAASVTVNFTLGRGDDIGRKFMCPLAPSLTDYSGSIQALSSKCATVPDRSRPVMGVSRTLKVRIALERPYKLIMILFATPLAPLRTPPISCRNSHPGGQYWLYGPVRDSR